MARKLLSFSGLIPGVLLKVYDTIRQNTGISIELGPQIVYPKGMTLSVRNNFFKGGIALAALSLCLVAFAGYFAYPAFPEAASSSAMRSQGMVQSLIANFAESSSYVPFWAMLCAVMYSFVSIILIYYFFEKTQSPEILFIGLFVISLTFEFARIVIPFSKISLFPAEYLVAASRVLLFGRHFGLFSLFAASVYAAGLDSQNQFNIFIILGLAALFIALNVPIDSLVWDSTFVLWNGYTSMFFMLEIGILVVSVVTFFISAYSRGSISYVLIGVSAFFALTGRNILINSDTLITLVPGFVILVIGTWSICARLHKEYLWL